MPISSNNLSRDRKNFIGDLTLYEINLLKNDKDIRVLQTSEPTSAKTWELLNEALFQYRSDIELRVYGHYSTVCDLSFLKQMGNVKVFSADCLSKAKGIASLGYLKKLENLSIGIYDLDNFDFLFNLPHEKIHTLSLCATKSKRPSLQYLSYFKNLKTLYLEGQQKDIETLSTLPSIEKLTLRSIATEDLNLIKPLKNLWYLDIKLGGRNDLSGLEELENIKYLELWQVRGLSNIDTISSLIGLQYIFLQSLPNITNIPSLLNLTSLRRIYIENMKGINNFKTVTSAPALTEFIHAMANGFEPSDYLDILKMPTLEKTAVWFGSDRKNKNFRDLTEKYNIKIYDHSPFVFKN